MNKNIEELAIQAGMTRTIGGNTPVFVNDGEIVKFAELLIKECMNAIFYSAQRADEYTSPKVFAKDVIVQVTEHYLS